MAKKQDTRGQTYMRLSRVVDTRVIWCGDNLEYLKRIPDKCIDLIYIDPPFFTGRDHEVIFGEEQEERAFEDRHASITDYLDWMRPRCAEIRRVLRGKGSFYFHCDWHASHYIKCMLDDIFGRANFQNEIIWKRTSAHSSATRYGPNHDTILFYDGGEGHTWNQQYQAYDEDYIETFYTHVDKDGKRWRRSDLTAPGRRSGDSGQPWRGIDPTSKGRHWAVPREAVEQLKLAGVTTQGALDAMDAGGFIHWPKKEGGIPQFKRYAHLMPGVPLQTVWNDIKPLHNLSKERVGYPTQKPLALMERIIKCSSNPGDIVLDAFCGCGTTIEAAENLGRQWIGVDFSPTACKVMAKRLRDKCKIKEDEDLWSAGRGFVVKNLPWTEERLKQIPPGQFQDWAVLAVNGIPNPKKVGDMGIDGKVYPASSTQPGGMGTSGEQLEFTLDLWYPVQVKQRDKVGRPDIDSFEAVMMREKKNKGVFVGFDFTKDAHHEIRKFQQRTGLEIIPVTVSEILKIESKRRYA